MKYLFFNFCLLYVTQNSLTDLLRWDFTSLFVSLDKNPEENSRQFFFKITLDKVTIYSILKKHTESLNHRIALLNGNIRFFQGIPASISI